MPRPELRSDLNGIVFSSGDNYPVAEALATELSTEFPTMPYRSFFDHPEESILTTFLRKLLTIDVAILILGADDLQLKNSDPTSTETIYVPRDNVVFELGASMARLGTRKVFMLVPSGLDVRVLSYMRDKKLLTYTSRPHDISQDDISQITNTIFKQLSALDEDLFHSDLPALGLVQSYFFNFVSPVYLKLTDDQPIPFKEEKAIPWDKSDGFTLTIVIPDRLMGRRDADAFCKDQLGADNVTVRVNDGRDLSVYILPRTHQDAPLHIIDIPTTLLTSEEVIKRVDDFWRTQGEELELAENLEFREQLAQREIATFHRRMPALLEEKGIHPSRNDLNSVHVVPLADLEQHLQSLQAL